MKFGALPKSELRFGELFAGIRIFTPSGMAPPFLTRGSIQTIEGVEMLRSFHLNDRSSVVPIDITHILLSGMFDIKLIFLVRWLTLA